MRTILAIILLTLTIINDYRIDLYCDAMTDGTLACYTVTR